MKLRNQQNEWDCCLGLSFLCGLWAGGPAKCSAKRREPNQTNSNWIHEVEWSREHEGNEDKGKQTFLLLFVGMSLGQRSWIGLPFLFFSSLLARRGPTAAKKERKKDKKKGGTPKRSPQSTKKERRAAQRNFLLCGLWGGAHLRHAISFHQSPLIPLQPFCLNPLIKKETSEPFN